MRNRALISYSYRGPCGNLSSWTARQVHRQAPSAGWVPVPKTSPSMTYQKLGTAWGDAQLRKITIPQPPQHLLARRCLLFEYERDRSSSRTNWCFRALVSHSGSRWLMWGIKSGHYATRLCSLEKVRNHRLIFEQPQDFNRIDKASLAPECWYERELV